MKASGRRTRRIKRTRRTTTAKAQELDNLDPSAERGSNDSDSSNDESRGDPSEALCFSPPDAAGEARTERAGGQEGTGAGPGGEGTLH